MMKNCLDCGIKISNKKATQRCIPCANKARNYHPSVEVRKKISKNSTKIWLGKKLSKEHKLKMVETRKKNNSYKSKRKGLTLEQEYGIERAFKIKIKMSRSRIGIRTWNYIDGRSKIISNRYGNDWNIIRHLIYSRDHHTCQSCGITNIMLDVHHKVPFLISFDNSSKNLISLCRSCHMKIEKKDFEIIKWGQTNELCL